jgi:hypothetical protein
MDSILAATAKRADLAECDHMLLYLNALTWTRGAESDILADEVAQAMDLGVHLLLAHESENSHRSHRDIRNAALTNSACIVAPRYPAWAGPSVTGAETAFP